MSRCKKRIALLSAIALFFCLSVAQSAQGASFDCAKASTKVEHIICDIPEISELDAKLGKDYQEVLGKASDEQKQRVIAEQMHWLKSTRNVCKKETCLKHAYWSRQAELETFFAPHSPLYKHESDKAEAIKQVLATEPLYESEGQSPSRQFCSQFFEDLKQMKGIRFVDPVVQTMSYEDLALDPWRQKCKGEAPLNFIFSYAPRKCRDDGNLTDCAEEMAYAMKNLTIEGEVSYGLPPFKLYELPPFLPTGKKLHIFYEDDTYGPMNGYAEKMPYVGGGYESSAGFTPINFAHCDESVEGHYFEPARGGARSRPNYNSIIVYRNQYYFLMLNEGHSHSYWLRMSPIGHGESCDWRPIKSTTTEKGSK